MEIWIIIGVVVLAIVAFPLVKYLKSKGYFQGDVVTEEQLIKLAQLIVQSSSFKHKDIYSKVLIASEHAVKYAEQIASRESMTNEQKKELALDAVYEILTVAEIKVTDELKGIIEISIEVAVSSLPKNK